MFKNRNLRFDLFALVLLVVAVMLAVSLATYDASDPPSTLVYPPHTEYHNACGPIGAYVTHFLLESVGIGAYYLLASLAGLSIALLWRGEVDQPVLRAVGWVASLVAIATLATLAFPNMTPGPVIGAGGYLGAMGQALLETHFATAGAYILAISILLAGLLLSTDYFVFRAIVATTALSGHGLMSMGHFGHSVRRRDRPKTDLEDEFVEGEEDEYEYEEEELEEDEEWEEEEDVEDEAPTLKVRTPNSKQEDEVEEEEEPEQPAPAKPLKSKLTSALSIKRKKKPEKSEREEIIDQLEAADQSHPNVDADYELPSLDLLLESEDVCYEEHEREVRRKAKILEKTFRNFGFNVKVVEIETGPVIAQYEVQLEAGLRLAKITNLSDDLAIALRVPSVRIVAPIPGKNTVGIEVPNENRQLVRIRDVIEQADGRAKRMKIPIYLGKDVSGNPMVVDLTTLPHLLIAGRTGTGKSVCLNSIIVSMLMSSGPDEVRMLMIDPKMVELSGYRKLPHLMHPVVTDMKKAEAILSWAVDKMEERYQLLARAGVRHISVFNQLGEEELRDRIRPKSEAEWETIPKQLPFVVIVADEIADLMMTAGKDVEQHIIRLAQKSRAVGIHLILATQKPTVDVITGLIKSNLPARIAFQVASRTDSRVVLDEMGADKLLGNGDMLFLSPGTSQLLRGQGTFLSDDEITRVVDFVGTDAPQFAQELIELKTKDEEEETTPGKLKNRDELYEAAVDVVVRERRGSVSLLQRCLGIGYGRAARLIDFMAEDGIVGEYNGSQAREVAISVEEWEAMSSEGEESSEPATGPVTVATVPAKPRRANNKIIPGTDEPSDLEEDEATATAPWEDEEEAELEDDEEWEEEDEAEEGEVAEDEEEEWEEEKDEEEAELEDDEEWEEEDEAEEGEVAEDDEEWEDEEEEAELEDDEEWEEDEEEYADSA
ncbi:MAG: DNA translocase FtsK [Planctomycetes bacterium]|nr:DNA translocase FtsK [Planctomycetota bacterium]